MPGLALLSLLSQFWIVHLYTGPSYTLSGTSWPASDAVLTYHHCILLTHTRRHFLCTYYTHKLCSQFTPLPGGYSTGRSSRWMSSSTLRGEYSALSLACARDVPRCHFSTNHAHERWSPSIRESPGQHPPFSLCPPLISDPVNSSSWSKSTVCTTA